MDRRRIPGDGDQHVEGGLTLSVTIFRCRSNRSIPGVERVLWLRGHGVDVTPAIKDVTGVGYAGAAAATATALRKWFAALGAERSLRAGCPQPFLEKAFRQQEGRSRR